jgi:Kiwa protein KwaB-like
MPALDDLQQFDFDNANVILWTFKARVLSGGDPVYSGRWVDTTPDVDATLKEIAAEQVALIEEVQEYSLLAQNNEGSVLSISTLETHAGLILEAAAEELEAKKVTETKHLKNSEFYVMKFSVDDTIVLAVKKADPGWRTKKASNARNLFFADQQLAIDTRPHFEIAKAVDFFVFGENILCINKGKFESVLRYKQAHKDDFSSLQVEPEFASVFSEVGPLIEYIGENKIQLRRASAIKQKGHYKDNEFMDRLRARQTEYKLAISFDKDGKIIATSESAADIIVALLDHRLGSGFSESVYEVQNTIEM